MVAGEKNTYHECIKCLHFSMILEFEVFILIGEGMKMF